jgi:hypothetical protein
MTVPRDLTSHGRQLLVVAQPPVPVWRAGHVDKLNLVGLELVRNAHYVHCRVRDLVLQVPDPKGSYGSRQVQSPWAAEVSCLEQQMRLYP